MGAVPFSVPVPDRAAASPFDLRGLVVLITGATGGLGEAIAASMAAHGATLLLSDHDADAVEAAAAALRRGGHAAHAIACDLASPNAGHALAAQAIAVAGHVDVLVCNAGIQGPAGPLGSITEADWERVMAVNVRSAVDLGTSLAPGMARRGGGSIVLMTSIAALRGNRAIGLYGMSKAALSQLARNLAVEWGPRNVRVNAIAPGLIRTPLSAGLMADEAFMQRRLAMTPLRRAGEASEVAGMVVLLASAAGGFITGQTLVIDGGTLISDGS